MKTNRSRVGQGANCVVLVTEGQTYAFVYDDENTTRALLCLGRFAASSELNFSWNDAARLSRTIVDRQVRRTSSVGLGDFTS